MGQLLKRLAPRIGAKVMLEPAWGVAGQIRFKSGRTRYFRYTSLDLNPVGASDIAKDKDYANFFMQKLGYATIPGRTFFSDAWCEAIGSTRNIGAAYAYASKLGFPVIVKPNSQSQGRAVALAHTRRDFYRAMRAVFEVDRVALVQQAVRGQDYRVVVLDGRVVSAYERIPLNIVGDGRSTVAQLLARKQRAFVRLGRDTVIKLDDPRMRAKLARQKLTMRSVVPKGTLAYLLDNANLSSGGDAVDVTGSIHPAFKRLAVRLTRDMGLRLCGVDLMVEGGIDRTPGRYWILEINAAPGLDHYVKSGKAQQKIVEDFYLEVLKSLEH